MCSTHHVPKSSRPSSLHSGSKVKLKISREGEGLGTRLECGTSVIIHKCTHTNVHTLHSLSQSESVQSKSGKSTSGRSSRKRARECGWDEVLSSLDGLQNRVSIQNSLEQCCTPKVFMDLGPKAQDAVVTLCGLEGWRGTLCQRITVVSKRVLEPFSNF